MTTEHYDYDHERQAQDMIEKYVADGLTPEAALRKWEYLGRDMPDLWMAEMLNKEVRP